MPKDLRRLLAVMVITYVALYAFAFALAVFEFPGLTVHQYHMWRWIMARTTAVFLRELPAAHVFAVLVTVSLLLFSTELGENRQTGSLPVLRRIMAVTVTIAVVFAVSELWIVPQVRASQEFAEQDSVLVDQLRERADQALRDREFADARRSVRTLLALRPGDREAEELQLEIERAREREEELQELERAPLEESPSRARTSRSAVERYEIAREAYEAKDYFTAHFEASRAFRADSALTSARDLAERAWRRIEEGVRDVAEDRAFFNEKRRGLRALRENDVVGAYYLFRELEEQAPDDRDVQRYLTEAEEELAERHFFFQDAEEYLALPGYFDVTLVSDGPNGGVDAIRFGKLVPTPDGIYATGVSVLGIAADGSLDYRLIAPYGKVMGDYLALRALDREEENSGYGPEYLEGERPAGLQAGVPLSTGGTRLLGTARATTHADRMTAPELWRVHRWGAVRGGRRAIVLSELLRRVAAPVELLVLSFVAVGIGSRMRSRYRFRPPFPVFVLLPAAPAVVWGVAQLYSYAHRTLISAGALWGGMAAGIGVLAAAAVLGLVASLAYAARWIGGDE